LQNGLRVSGVHCMRWLGSPARERHERFLALLDPTGSQESANGSIDKVTIPGDRSPGIVTLSMEPLADSWLPVGSSSARNRSCLSRAGLPNQRMQWTPLTRKPFCKDQALDGAGPSPLGLPLSVLACVLVSRFERP